MAKRDFLRIADASPLELEALFARAEAHKGARALKQVEKTLQGRTLVTLFEKHSTRTLLSFHAAMGQLGGTAIQLSSTNSQLSRGEPLSDTARVIGRFADVAVFRTHAESRLHTFAQACEAPVINGLSEGGHPVQVLADLLTVKQRLGKIAGATMAFLGDTGSNMGLSFVEAAQHLGFALRLGSPPGYHPPAKLLQEAEVLLTDAPEEAVRGANVVITDVWTSMGQEDQAASRRAALAPYQVNAKLLARAASDAVFLHCLPAHRGEEVTAEVLDGPQSGAWDEAENRLHVQKALLELLLGISYSPTQGSGDRGEHDNARPVVGHSKSGAW